MKEKKLKRKDLRFVNILKEQGYIDDEMVFCWCSNTKTKLGFVLALPGVVFWSTDVQEVDGCLPPFYVISLKDDNVYICETGEFGKYKRLVVEFPIERFRFLSSLTKKQERNVYAFGVKGEDDKYVPLMLHTKQRKRMENLIEALVQIHTATQSAE